MAAQRVAERRALLDVRLDVAQGRLEDHVLLLVGEDVEALHERQAGVDHRGELAREGDELFGADARAELEAAKRAALLDLDGVELLLAQAVLDGGLRLGLHRALAQLAGARSRFPGKISHLSLVWARPAGRLAYYQRSGFTPNASKTLRIFRGFQEGGSEDPAFAAAVLARSAPRRGPTRRARRDTRSTRRRRCAASRPTGATIRPPSGMASSQAGGMSSTAKVTRDAIEPTPASPAVSRRVATRGPDVGVAREQVARPPRERFVDFDREHRAGGRDDVAREGGSVARARPELGQAIARLETEDAERQQIGVRSADGGQPLVVEQERRVDGALGDVPRDARTVRAGRRARPRAGARRTGRPCGRPRR